ncbi:3-methyl-2-oxobutanoate hydroxymethyltransferase [Lyngbya confervoides]|uniref:3-methyl-2-oxobutanoate hydroxymethyltransferase n=1 Tax=Lyngbya confervoides BDU141951 TaxID=1574623 RepID=A0ABD4T0U3_9CYAN|nr:3-methyl-2-oxobutanoate hydroxymethyltransferase [Lyngbya confervoides]MCM1982192.1 3-methyl-2-oxobutanoate hydroxymethyltransferase [Lyngbya confervoides BDU141951]
MKVTVHTLQKKKRNAEPIVALTAWDYLFAELIDQAGVDVVLVGDSLAMVALGHPTTLPMTLETMLHHAQAVSRGVQQALLVCDLPFLSYQESPQVAFQVAGRIIQETQAQAVKLEGGYSAMVDTVSFLVQRGIPVMGHLGLTPQSVHQLGYRQQGKTPEAAEQILTQARALESAGAFSIVLEHIPKDVAAQVTQSLTIPTIGIGAGPACDGQILVTADLLGLTSKQPPFAPPYLNLRSKVQEAVQAYSQDVRQGKFP